MNRDQPGGPAFSRRGNRFSLGGVVPSHGSAWDEGELHLRGRDDRRGAVHDGKRFTRITAAGHTGNLPLCEICGSCEKKQRARRRETRVHSKTAFFT
jgi:hypothetical protein